MPDPEAQVPCAVCSVTKSKHGFVVDGHSWMDPEDHWEAHRPPNDDTAHCDTCQSLAEDQWEARFER